MGAGLVPEARAEPDVEFVRLGPSQLSFRHAPTPRRSVKEAGKSHTSMATKTANSSKCFCPVVAC